MKNNLSKILLGIFILALFLRLLAVFTQKEADRAPKCDASGYDEIAMNLVAGNGLSQYVNGSIAPIAYRTPVYPMFLAGIYYIFGHHYIAVKIIQAVLGALLCIVIFLISKLIYDDEAIGLIASLSVALYKPFITGFYFYGGPVSMYSESFFMFMVGSAVLALLYFVKKGGMKTGMLAGTLISLAALTRAEFAVFPILLAAYLLYMFRWSVKALLKKYLIVYLFIVLTVSPWVIRNYIIYKEFIPFNTLGGIIFWTGNNPLANGGQSSAAFSFEDGTNEKSKAYFKMGMDHLKSNPKRVPKLFIRKILVHWAPFSNGFSLFNAFYAVILLFGSIGILFFRKKNILENIVLLILWSTTLTAIITFGEPRYRCPYEPYLIIFSALAFIEIFRGIKQKAIL